MADPFIGQIVMFAGNFAPRGWAFCDGQLLQISQYQALFSILGTMYGGDGRITFGLPDLRCRVPMHPGQGPGLTPRNEGQMGGAERVQLNTTQLPNHSHTASSRLHCNSMAGNSDSPVNNCLAGSSEGDRVYGPPVLEAPMMHSESISTTIGAAGGGQAHDNIQPFTCVNFIIALQGTYPSRNK